MPRSHLRSALLGLCATTLLATHLLASSLPSSTNSIGQKRLQSSEADTLTLSTPTLAATEAAAPASTLDNPVSPGALPQVYTLLKFLNSVKGSYILSGQMTSVDWNGVDAWDHTDYELAWLQNNVGKLPAVRGFDFMFLNNPDDVVWGTKTPLQKVARDALRWHKAGGIVTIQWHWNLGTFPDKFSFYVMKNGAPATDWDLEKGLAPGTAENTKFNADMDAVAAELKVLRDAGVPVIWRPFHECSGNWFWWSAHYDATTGKVVKHPDLFKRAWKYMFDRFTRVHGLNNLIWEYNPNSDDGDLASWYPGDEYVDMISLDIYPPSGTHPTYASTYATFHQFTNGRKLVTMSENGAIPDIDACFTEGAGWSYFNTWAGNFLTDATKSGIAADSTAVANNLNFLKKTYKHPRVLTLDELPALYSSPDSRIINISTRAPVGLSNQPLIGGFVIKGTQKKHILLRAAGPSLGFFGLTNVLADPVLELYDVSGTLLTSNDNWADNSALAVVLAQAFTQTGAFNQLTLSGKIVETWPVGSKDAAILIDLPPGNYTAQVKSKVTGLSGTAMIEIYDADLTPSDSTLVNIATLCDVKSPDANIVAGFITKGSLRRVLVRGGGPALSAFGVTPLLANPAVLLQEANSGLEITSNDDWGTDTAVRASLRVAFVSTGAFDLYNGTYLWADSSKDSAFTISLVGGAYTSTLSGNNTTSGRAIIEVYDYP